MEKTRQQGNKPLEFILLDVVLHGNDSMQSVKVGLIIM